MTTIRQRARVGRRHPASLLKRCPWLILTFFLGVFSPATGEDRYAAIDVDEIRAGQRGYGLSVFAGAEPERFDVEVLGVQRNSSPGVSYILARLSGHDLELTGVAAGMSGSPVYIDGRLAGAVAFAWSFAEEPIAGITPIAQMRELATEPREERPSTWGSGVELEELVGRAFGPDFLKQEMQRLNRHLGMRGAGPTGLLWVASGFGESSLSLLSGAVGHVSPAGRWSPDEQVRLKAGSSVAAVLIDGDFQVAATGTVTEVHGDEILAFGHPFLGVGTIGVPMVAADVVTVMASLQSSFKVANTGPAVGAFIQDRLAGVRGRLGLEVPMLPLVLHIGGPYPKTYRMRIAQIPQIVPGLLVSSMIAGLEAASFVDGTQGLDLEARFELEDFGELEIRESFSSNLATSEAASLIVATASFLQNNSYEEVKIRGVEVGLVPALRPRVAVLTGVRPSSAAVRPGDPLTLYLDFHPYRGELLRRSIQVTLPQDLKPGPYTLVVGDGRQADGERQVRQPTRASDFSQALAALRSLHSTRELVVLGIRADRGLVVRGTHMPELPGSVHSVWRRATSPGVVELSSQVSCLHVEETDIPIRGLAQLEIEVLAPRDHESKKP